MKALAAGRCDLAMDELDRALAISDAMRALHRQSLDCWQELLGPALYRLLPFGGYALPLAASALSPAAAKG